MERESDEEKALAQGVCLAAQREVKKTREKPRLFSIRVHSARLQTERMLAKQAYSRGVLCRPC